MRLTTITRSGAAFEKRRYNVRHATSSAGLNPNTAGAARRPRFPNSLSKSKKLPGGIDPRSFQLLIADCPTPTKAAVAAVPPRASTMESTESSMLLYSSRSVNASRLHAGGVDNSQNVRFNNEMDGSRLIGRRLDLLLKALNALHGLTAEEIAGLVGSQPNAISQYRKGFSRENGVEEDRPLSVNVAIELCKRYPVDLDYFFRGEFGEVDLALQLKMKDIEQAEARGEPYKLIRRPRKITKGVRKAAG